MKAGAGCHLCFARVQNLVAGICFVLGVGIFLTPASAANVTIVVKTAERLEANDNRELSTNSSGNTFGSLSTISAAFDWQTPRLALSATSATSYRKEVGRGKSDNLNSFNPNLSLGLVKRGRNSQLSLSSSFRIQDTTFSELEDTDVTDQDADRLSFNLSSGWTYSVNSTNTLTFTNSISVVDFTRSSAELSPFTNFNSRAQWVHNLTNLTSVNGSLGWSQFKSDNVTNTETTTYSVTAGLSARLSPRLSVTAGGGLNLSNTERDQIVLGVNLGRSSVTTLGLQTNLGMKYSLRRTQFSFSLQQGLEPSAEGQLNQRSSLSFNIGHEINQHAAVSLATSFSRREAEGNSSGEVTDRFSMNPSFNYKLAPNWNAAVGYSFTLRDNDEGVAQSNKVFVSISRNTVLDP